MRTSINFKFSEGEINFLRRIEGTNVEVELSFYLVLFASGLVCRCLTYSSMAGEAHKTLSFSLFSLYIFKITVELPASNELKTETFGNISDKKVKGINNEDFEVLDLNSIDATGKIELNHISKGKLTKEAKVKHHQIWMNLL